MRIKILLVAIVAVLTVAVYLKTDLNSKEESADSTDQTEQEYLGEIFRLDERRISPGIDQISLKFILAKTLKYVAEAPPTVTAKSADAKILSVGATENTDPKKPFLFPVELTEGSSELTIDYRLFCCNSGPGAVCFFKEGRIIIPVTVAEDGDDSFEIKQMIDE